MTVQPSVEMAVILESVEEAFDRRAWHGPNLRGSLRGVDAAAAAWRPKPGRRSIAEHVLHAAYWKYVVRRRLTGQKRGSFPLAGSNWFAVSEALSQADWRVYITLLEDEHAALRETVAALPAERLDHTPNGSKVSNRAMIRGIAFHDIYHAGQINLLKRLREPA
jgi:uncharacterized damage-inducible protein DinB